MRTFNSFQSLVGYARETRSDRVDKLTQRRSDMKKFTNRDGTLMFGQFKSTVVKQIVLFLPSSKHVQNPLDFPGVRDTAMIRRPFIPIISDVLIA